MKTVGILLDASVFKKVKSKKTGHEKLYLYNRAAKKHGLTPVYLCLDNIKSNSSKAYCYQYVDGKYIYKKLTIPKVIHNRAMTSTSSLRKKLTVLKRKSIVFNAKNRYMKYYIHKLLTSNFSRHLPYSMSYSKANLRTMMGKYQSLHVKPQSSSIGKGIVQVVRTDKGKWRVRLPKKSVVGNQTIAVNKVHSLAKKQKYYIQETIPLAKFKGKPYDIRVTVQRGHGGKWQVTGTVGKIAGKINYVTNVARGGSVKKTNTLLAHNFSSPQAISHDLKQLSLNIARHLGHKLNRLADVGLDIGVNSTGKPYFIEMNGRDQRYGFKILKMNDTFFRTYETSIVYAKYLLNKK